MAVGGLALSLRFNSNRSVERSEPLRSCLSPARNGKRHNPDPPAGASRGLTLYHPLSSRTSEGAPLGPVIVSVYPYFILIFQCISFGKRALSRKVRLALSGPTPEVSPRLWSSSIAPPNG